MVCIGGEDSGHPLGNQAFVTELVQKRLADEQLLWGRIAAVPDLQCASQLHVQSAGPRCNCFLRTLPPTDSAAYAAAHDAGMQTVLAKLLRSTKLEESEFARHLASLPVRSGGLGIRSACRTAVPAFWASWADALPMLQARCPGLVDLFMGEMSSAPTSRVTRELAAARHELSLQGFQCVPSWQDLRDGARPDTVGLAPEPGEWAHGWQFHAASISETYFRRRVVFPACSTCSCSGFAEQWAVLSSRMSFSAT